MSEAAHALLGASSARRWMSCPGSALLTADMPDTTSAYAEEGTLAHAVCEAAARRRISEKYPSLPVTPVREIVDASPEMLDCAEVYCDTIAAIADELGPYPYIALEQRVDFSHWVPEGFGTADCIMIGGNTLHVIDYKHGKGVQVEAEDNPQLKLYALGALYSYSFLYDISVVRWSIVQPRNGGVSHAAPVFKESLLNWADEVVRPAATLAMTPGAPFTPGEWCRFCKAKGTCRARSDYNLALERFEKQSAKLMTPEEISDAILRGRDLVKWLADIEEEARNRLLTGDHVPGWKAVEGRAIRAWTDAEAAFRKAVALGVPDEMLWEKKPVTLAQLEKTMGKKLFTELSDYVTIPTGKPALAQESDKRPAILAQPSAEDDFA